MVLYLGLIWQGRPNELDPRVFGADYFSNIFFFLGLPLKAIQAHSNMIKLICLILPLSFHLIFLIKSSLLYLKSLLVQLYKYNHLNLVLVPSNLINITYLC